MNPGHPRAKKILKAEGPQTAKVLEEKKVEDKPPVLRAVSTLVRKVRCKDLGLCPSGRCGDQNRVCGQGLGIVRHLVECQTCEQYVQLQVRGKSK